MPRLIRLTTPAGLALLIASAAQAQMSVGVRGGLSYSELGGEIRSDSKSGLTAGAFVGVKIAGAWWIQPEIWYTQKGAKFEGVDPNNPLVPASYTIDLNYVGLLLPIGIDFTVESEKVQPRAYAGPTFAIALTCDRNSDTQDGASDCKENYKSNDFGLVFGFGVELGSGPGAFLADLRYDYGLADINNTNRTLDDVTRKNRSIQLLIGYRRHF